jgi:hypothetical protein
MKLHPQSLVDPGAIVGARTRVWAFAHVCDGVVIGEDCNLCDHTFFEKGVRLGNRLNSGGYYLKLLVVKNGNKVTYTHESLASFTVVDIAERKGSWMGREPGVVQLLLEWNIKRVSEN